MEITEMVLEQLTPEEGFRALVYFRGVGGFVTAVGFELIMLAVFVAFPVVLAAEGAAAGGQCAAPGTFVTFHVFSVGKLAGWDG